MSLQLVLIEDELSIADTLIYALKTENFIVQHFITGQQALDYLKTHPKTAGVVLDVGLPDLTGFDVCRTLRTFSDVPVLFLTARNSEIDEVLGLELGADDYVTKPFSPRAVTARVRALLRRSAKTQTTSSPGIIHDPEAKQILWQEQKVDLTAHEYHLLATLISQPERVLSREQLLAKAWSDPFSITDRAVDAHIKSIRAKLRSHSAQAADAIKTRRGLGYAWCPDF